MTLELLWWWFCFLSLFGLLFFCDQRLCVAPASPLRPDVLGKVSHGARCFRRTDVKDLKATDNSTETEQDESILHLGTTHPAGTEAHNHIVC